MADPVDWKVCHSGSEAPAALRDVRRNLMRVRVIAGITGSPGVAVDVGQVAITVMAVRRDVRRVVIVVCRAVRPERVLVLIRPECV